MSKDKNELILIPWKDVQKEIGLPNILTHSIMIYFEEGLSLKLNHKKTEIRFKYGLLEYFLTSYGAKIINMVFPHDPISKDFKFKFLLSMSPLEDIIQENKQNIAEENKKFLETAIEIAKGGFAARSAIKDANGQPIFYYFYLIPKIGILLSKTINKLDYKSINNAMLNFIFDKAKEKHIYNLSWINNPSEIYKNE